MPENSCSATGAELAESVAARLNLATEKRKILDIIIRQHLLLVRTARLQDLKSAHVIQSVAAQVPDMDALRHLYVFTYIDTYAVAEKNWTSMDERDLEDLYQRMQEFFSSGADENAGNEAF
jgi:[protein-PII] uridylyltransferase